MRIATRTIVPSADQARRSASSVSSVCIEDLLGGNDVDDCPR